MSGTSESAIRTAKSRVARDPEFYRRIGAIGGAKSKRHLTHETASEMGRRGGAKSRRKPSQIMTKRRQQQLDAQIKATEAKLQALHDKANQL